MIIDFTVSNYRSIREAVTLSFVAQKGRGKSPDDEVGAGYAVPGRDFKLLPVAGLFGANASGKSNVLRALNALLELMDLGGSSERALKSDLVPFKLDINAAKASSNFEVRVALEGSIFIFTLSVRSGFILSEKLEYSPQPEARRSVRLLYSRTWDEQSGTYRTKTGEHFAGPHTQLLRTIEKHEPYISLLRRLKIDVTAPLMEWLSARPLGSFTEFDSLDQEFSAEVQHKIPVLHDYSKRLVRAFDTGLSNIVIEKVPDKYADPRHQVWAVHSTPEGEVRWDLKEESLGTQKLFALGQAFMVAIDGGAPCIVDEFGSNFHPRITREIIRLFHSPETNPKGAQLIFTSHDNTLWRGGSLRRDEIWLTEKQADGSTRLFPLSDYKVRSDMALDKAYMDGRFGAVPVLDDVEDAIVAGRQASEIAAEEAARVSG